MAFIVSVWHDEAYNVGTCLYRSEAEFRSAFKELGIPDAEVGRRYSQDDDEDEHDFNDGEITAYPVGFYYPSGSPEAITITTPEVI